MAYEYELLDVDIDGRVATVTVSNPPINLITVPLYMELASLAAELRQDPDLSCLLLQVRLVLEFLAPDIHLKFHLESQ